MTYLYLYLTALNTPIIRKHHAKSIIWFSILLTLLLLLTGDGQAEFKSQLLPQSP
ncbi:hypothetical protein PAUR_a2637 [Pseudoalteromonas aurantia 208]|uniref:Uncharacterized protein n=1 Tax=Pseudoalteromonas aurantia 208 TaxID=1314867 RepID=A0ABR9ED52_9GAMM|nr:hypothetical protein [Pseudoalteromonas aurantia 208]